MNRSTVICAIEHALREDGCNEVIVADLFQRVRRTRGNLNLSEVDLLAMLNELIADGLFQAFGDGAPSSETLVARSQNHPSVPIGTSIILKSENEK